MGEIAVRERGNKTERVRKLAIHMLENPKMSRQELAASFGVSYQVLCALMRDSQLLQQIGDSARKRMVTMIPLAVQGIEDSLHEKGKIKFMAAQEVLRSEKVLGPDRVDVTINDNSQRTIEELQEKIRRAQAIPHPTIDAEIIS